MIGAAFAGWVLLGWSNMTARSWALPMASREACETAVENLSGLSIGGVCVNTQTGEVVSKYAMKKQ